MNSMWLSDDLAEAARWHPGKHRKLILEAGQMMSTALYEHGLDHLAWYDPNHVGHALTRWTSDSVENWHKMRQYCSALHEEFYEYSIDDLQGIALRWSDDAVRRLYDEGHIHKTVMRIALARAEGAVETAFPDIGLTARPKCMASEHQRTTVTESYRAYFRDDKQHEDWFEWRCEPPDWAKHSRWSTA